MLYLAIAKTPMDIKTADGKTATTHPFFVQYVNDRQEMIPVFLSKLQAYIYLKPVGLLEEFQLVTTDSVFLSVYRNTANWAKETNTLISSAWCQVVRALWKTMAFG